jgi:fatty-acyl-CoA synthase
MTSPYDKDLDKNPANHQPLTPLTYLERAAKVFPDHVAIVHGASPTSGAARSSSPPRFRSAASARATRSR